MVITTTDFQLFQILKQKLGEEEAEVLVSYIVSEILKYNKANLKELTTEEDIANLDSRFECKDS